LLAILRRGFILSWFDVEISQPFSIVN